MKKTGALMIAFIMCMLMSSCGAQGDASQKNNAAQSETQVEEAISDNDTAVSPTQIDESEWASAYKKYLLGKYKKNEQDVENDEEQYMPYSYFTLCYMDEDDVPEIMVMDDGSHVGTATIVTYHDGLVKAFSGLGSNGRVYFHDKENVIIGDYMGSGSHSISVYHLSDGSLVTDWESYKMDGTWLPNGGTIDYYTYGAVVTAEEYQEQYDHFVPSWYDPWNGDVDSETDSSLYSSEYEYDGMLNPEEIEKVFNQWIH